MSTLVRADLNSNLLVEEVVAFGLTHQPADRYIGMTDGNLAPNGASGVVGWTRGPDSLGSVATQLENLPTMFETMSQSMDSADDNLVTVKTSLSTMATNVSGISTSLDQYKSMVAQSQSSMDNIKGILTSVEENLDLFRRMREASRRFTWTPGRLCALASGL